MNDSSVCIKTIPCWFLPSALLRVTVGVKGTSSISRIKPSYVVWFIVCWACDWALAIDWTEGAIGGKELLGSQSFKTLSINFKVSTAVKI